AARAQTAVPLDRLWALNEALMQAPSGFTVHKKLERLRERRAHALAIPDDRSIDWSAAEDLAFASILADGTSIRLAGGDLEPRPPAASGARSRRSSCCCRTRTRGRARTTRARVPSGSCSSAPT